MPVKWLLHPGTGERLSFEEAPARLDRDGLMPSFAVEAVVKQHKESKPSFNVRPSDLVPAMECRRQRVWMESHDYGVNPLDEEAQMEGSGFHHVFGTMEMTVPPAAIPYPKELVNGNVAAYAIAPDRLPVCGVLMRGRVDWLDGDTITDLKTTAPFWIARFATKEQKAKDPTLRPWAEIWEPKSYDDDIKKWRAQLSAYGVLLKKSGQPAPTKGIIWRRYGGVKSDKPRYTKFTFALLTEEQLETEMGPWMRSLRDGLATVANNLEAWRDMPADGREMIGSKGNMWKCDKCPCRKPCENVDLGTWAGF